MKKYERAKQKTIVLHSIENYTISTPDGKEVLFNRKSKKRNIQTDNRYDGKGWGQSRRDSTPNWFSSPQHQQNIQGKRACDYRLSFKNCREHGPGSGIKTKKKMSEAA